MTGKGLLHAPENKSYEGEFLEGKLNGEGRFFVKDGTYCLSGTYNMGVPEFEASKYQFELTSPLEVEEEDPKAKKAPPAKAPAATSEEEEGNEIKI